MLIVKFQEKEKNSGNRVFEKVRKGGIQVSEVVVC